MEFGTNTETAVQGGTFLAAITALAKSFWRDWRHNKNREHLDARFKEINERLRGHDDEIEAHALYDAKHYVTRDELTNVVNRLDTKLDTKFESLNSNIIVAIRDGNGRKAD